MMTRHGLWTGRKVVRSFMVDTGSHLLNGSLNPYFRANEGNFKKTWQQIDHNGSVFPEIPAGAVPEGFKATDHLTRRSPFTGGLTPSETSLAHMMNNPHLFSERVMKEVPERCIPRMMIGIQTPPNRLMLYRTHYLKFYRFQDRLRAYEVFKRL
jgi:hypothetical protein